MPKDIHQQMCIRDSAEGGFGIVVPLQSDAGTFQSIGDGTHHHLDGVLLAFSLNGDAEGCLLYTSRCV